MAEPPRAVIPGERVWYVAYGSNMSTERLMVYLEGGQLGNRTYPGARDPRPPRISRGVRIRGRLRFAGTSAVWGGGVAYLDPAAPGSLAAVAHLVRMSQVADIVAQECGMDPGADLDLADLRPGGRAAVVDHRYGTIVHLGDDDGVPALTFTCAWPDGRSPTEPTPPYLATMAAGLRSHHRVDGTDLAHPALAGRPVSSEAPGPTVEPWPSRPAG